MKGTVFWNGRFVSAARTHLALLSPVLFYSGGCFETMRAYRGHIVYFREHLARIKNSAQDLSIRMIYSVEELKKIILRTVACNGYTDSYVRLTIFKSVNRTDTLVEVKNYIPYPARKYNTGFAACLSCQRQNEGSLLAQHKTTNRLIYQLALSEAARKNCDEAIILNSRGYLAEGSRSNIFFTQGRALYTPALACGCLGGITRKAVMDIAEKNAFKVYQGSFTIQDLYACQSAFVTNSLWGVMPLAVFEKRRISVKNKLMRLLLKEYLALLRENRLGDNFKRFLKWL